MGGAGRPPTEGTAGPAPAWPPPTFPGRGSSGSSGVPHSRASLQTGTSPHGHPLWGTPPDTSSPSAQRKLPPSIPGLPGVLTSITAPDTPFPAGEDVSSGRLVNLRVFPAQVSSQLGLQSSPTPDRCLLFPGPRPFFAGDTRSGCWVFTSYHRHCPVTRRSTRGLGASEH